MKSASLKTGSINEVHTNEAMNSPADLCRKKDLHFDRKSSNNDIQEEEKAEPKEEKLDANITQTADSNSPARLKLLKSIEPPNETLHPDDVREEVVGRDRLWSG